MALFTKLRQVLSPRGNRFRSKKTWMILVLTILAVGGIAAAGILYWNRPVIPSGNLISLSPYLSGAPSNQKMDDLSRAYAEKVTITIQSVSRASDHDGTAGITVQSPDMPSILAASAQEVLRQGGNGDYTYLLQKMKDSVKKKLSENCAMKKTVLKAGVVKENGKWKLAQSRKLSDALDGGMTDSLAGILKSLKVGETK